MDLQSSVAHVQEVIRSAKDELNQLLRDRAAIMKRIGTIKQTLAGLANLFGDSVLSEDLLEQLGRKSRLQQGFTRACRLVLMEASVPLGIREACEELRRTAPGVLERHKHPTASVATVFNRLVQYGEARSFRNVRGRRVWQYIAEPTQATSAVWMTSLALPDNAAATGD
jgi:chorismate mutase